MVDGTMHTLEHDEKREETAVRDDASREPVKHPEAIAAQAAAAQDEDNQNTPRTAMPKMEVTRPKETDSWSTRLGHRMRGYRHSAITNLPAPLVNNASNTIAVTQLAAEMAMFKANGTDFMAPRVAGQATKLHHYITRPPMNIWRAVADNASFNMTLKDLVRPTFYKDIAKSFVDLAHATKLDAPNGERLINRWQARSSFMGVTTMAITAIVPDTKDDLEEVEKNAIQLKTNPVGYAVKRVGQAIWFPVEVVKYTSQLVGSKFGMAPPLADGAGVHKRQFAGLGLFFTGFFSFLSGFRNVGLLNKDLGQYAAHNTKYVGNWAHSAGGAITAAAGATLLMALDNDQGWSRYGAMQWGRMLFLPKSIYNRYHKHDPRAHWYLGAQVGLQSANTVSFLIGGAEKLPDGTIVDHSAIREEAKLKAKITVDAKREGKPLSPEEIDRRADDIRDDGVVNNSVPATKISAPSQPTHAMPERVTAHEQQQIPTAS